MLYKTVFTLFVFYLTAINGEDREGWPGYYSCPDVKGWLKIHLEPADFDNARAKCKEEGAQLVNPFVPEFKKNAENLLNASSTAEKPILAVYSLAKVHHVSDEGTQRGNGVLVHMKKHVLNCAVFSPNGVLYRTECETKLPFICYAKDHSADLLFGSKLADEPELLAAPYSEELQYFDPNTQNNKNLFSVLMNY